MTTFTVNNNCIECQVTFGISINIPTLLENAYCLGLVYLITICLYLDTYYNTSFNYIFLYLYIGPYIFIININYMFYISVAIMLFDVNYCNWCLSLDIAYILALTLYLYTFLTLYYIDMAML